MRSNRFNLISYHRYKNLNRNNNRDQGPGHPITVRLIRLSVLLAHRALINVKINKKFSVSNKDDQI